MGRPVQLGIPISKFPPQMGLGCGQLRLVKHAQQVNSFSYSGSKIVHIYFSSWIHRFYSIGLEKLYKPTILSDKNQNHLFQCQNDVLMSFVERVNQGESLDHWLNWLTDPLLCASLWSCGTYHLGQKESAGPVQRPLERDHQTVLCKAWSKAEWQIYESAN